MNDLFNCVDDTPCRRLTLLLALLHLELTALKLKGFPIRRSEPDLHIQVSPGISGPLQIQVILGGSVKVSLVGCFGTLEISLLIWNSEIWISESLSSQEA